jgi:hypothetical protein
MILIILNIKTRKFITQIIIFLLLKLKISLIQIIIFLIINNNNKLTQVEVGRATILGPRALGTS